MYGIIPIRVEDPLTHLSPNIVMKDSIRPDQFQYVSVNEKDGRPMAYTLAIVDEGLLDLTGYSTPNPWGHFNKKEALGIRTWDIYSHVIGSFGSKWGNVLAVGGGGGGYKLLMKKKTVKANRFKPIVKYFGPYYLKAGERKKHKFKINNYVGAVRVMVVAANKGAYGNAEKSVKVKQPLMVLSTLPRTLSPGEEIEIPVNVFAMQKGLGNVSVELKTRSGLTIIGESKKTVQINDIEDRLVTFKAKVKKQIGLIEVEALVKSGAEKASHKTELDIRLPNPMLHKTQEWVLEGSKEITGNISQFGIEGTNKTVIEISRIPSINLSQRLAYLTRYPHGCIEQTVSAAFPQLYLSKVMKLSIEKKKVITRNIEDALFKLNNFQSSDGGFTYWPGAYYQSEWGTNYAGHFMLMAEREGYTISPTMKNNWIRHQKQKANSWVPSRYNNSQLQQAYRLYTLALAGQAHLPSMNRLRQERNLTQTAAWKLAAAYALVGRRDVAVQLTKSLPKDVKKYRELASTFGSSFRDKALVLETLTLLRSAEEATKVAIELAKEMGSDRWLSTQETAFGLMSISRYLGAFSTSDRIQFSYRLNNEAVVNIDTKEAIHQIGLSDNKTTFTLSNTGNSVYYVRSINSGVPLSSKKTAINNQIHMVVKYQTLTGKNIPIDKLEQGTQFVAEITIKNTSTHRNLKHMALSHMVPSGWEIQNTRMSAGTFTTPESRFDHKDFRDDRINTYFALKSSESKTFRVVLTATYLGKFEMPLIQCEAMYDYSVRAIRPGQSVSVVREGALENASSD
jgi:alpha-2-macroglobulin